MPLALAALHQNLRQESNRRTLQPESLAKEAVLDFGPSDATYGCNEAPSYPLPLRSTVLADEATRASISPVQLNTLPLNPKP